MGNFTLMNTGPLASVANNFINKLSSAVGWYVTRETPESLALNTLIGNIQESNLSPLDKAVMISNAKNILKEYSNKANIIQKAIPMLNEAAKPENVDNDWIAAFMDKSRLFSGEEFQLIWAKILAEECNEPGSISKQLLVTLAQMDKVDAKSFASICSFSLKIQNENETESHPLIDLTKVKTYYSTYDVTFTNLRNLVALGLIDFEEHTEIGYTLNVDKPILSISYGDKILNFPNPCYEIGIGSVILKKTGKELFKAISTTQHADFLDEIVVPYLNRYWENQKLSQQLKKSLDELDRTAKTMKDKGRFHT